MVLRSAQNHGSYQFSFFIRKVNPYFALQNKIKNQEKRILRDTILKETDKQTDRGSYEKYSDHETLF
ncbi:hypothetical protein ATC1_13339 [Flexilinea flocculi]|jgi:hypothetical protein|uniref:Uncharacterized protein n=1 Tax=Flexilinea flocculi TaxID=1678840 RepID=A0A0S7BRQ8_9CHLR|nr:hypothetical protein ATC1_13339 [Flexilinea flocculi]